MSLTVDRDRLPLREVFTISRGSKTEAQVLTVTVARDGAQAMLRENGQTLPITLDAPSFWPRLSEDGKTLTFATVEKQQVVLYKLER